MPSATAPARRRLTTARARALACGGLGLGVGLLLLLARGLSVVEGLELRLVDVRTRAHAGSRPPDPRILLVQVQEEDVAALAATHEWPWDLDVFATMFQTMADAKVKAVLVDVFHFDKGAGSDDYVREAGKPPIDDPVRFQAEEGAAELYRDALASLGRAALAFQLNDHPRYEVPARLAAVAGKTGAEGLVPPPTALSRSGANLPARRVAEGAALIGFANVDPDLDGIVRRAPTVGRWGERPALSLPLAGARIVTGRAPRLEDGSIVVDGTRTPLDPDGSFLVDFRGADREVYPRLSPQRLFAWSTERESKGEVPAEARAALEGKIVVFGINLPGHEDVVPTSVAAVTDGPEFQATVLDDLLNGGGRAHAGGLADAALLLAITTLVGLAGGASKRRVATHVAGLGGLVVVTALAWFAFGRGVVLDAFTPLLGVLLAWGGATALRLMTEGRYSKWLEGAFSRYLAPSVIEALKRNPGLLHLGGDRRPLTILFSDVAGFTNLSRKLTPDQVVTLLNAYLTAHCDAVFETGGVVDKFIGDAVMGFWGDPVPMPDQALRACTTALAVQARLPALRPLWESMGLETFEVRVGLNSGDAVVGNMGSRHRFDYTCMGDTVNLASRLEGANKAFGTRILIGGNTYEQAKQGVLARPLARLGVVGRDVAEPVYELLALATDAPPALISHVGAFVRAQDLARAGDLDGAERALDAAERLKPGDGPTAWFRGVLSDLRAGRLPAPWSGIVILGGK